jgi:G3E family GTPase
MRTATGRKRSGRAQPAGPPALAPEPQQRSGLSGLRLDFDADTTFDTIGLLEWARLAPVARVKGVMRIAEGLVRINRQGRICILKPKTLRRRTAVLS